MLLQGLRVVEMGFWVAGPAAAGILADWGADVVKIEPPRGDPMRQFYRALAGVELPSCPGFDLDNRGKRSVALDLSDPEQRAAARALVLGADVFITNYRSDALARLGFDYESLAAENPRLVYGHVTGYGQEGPDAGRAAYDIGAFWSRSGVAMVLTSAGEEPIGSRAGFGDHTTAAHCLAGVLAALLAREKTGKGQLVDACLLRSGIYTIGFDLAQQLAFGGVLPLGKRESLPSPTITSFRSGDGRWVWLLGVEAERHWPRLCRALELDSLVSDPRFATPPARAANGRELIAILDEQFAKRSLADWIPRFDAADLWWAPVNTAAEVTEDPQAIAAGAFVEVPDGKGGVQKSVASPVRFSAADVTPRAKAPGIGEHTEEVLAELRRSAR
ncbi:MAG TPA: CoA transferase [Myxococcota bacterium]|nr:CoA transferase [Myxococcota bacterium]